MQEKSATEVLVNVLGLGLVLLIFFLGFRYFDIETVRGWIASAGIWAPLAFIVAKASTIVIAPLGGAFLYPLAGALFGLSKGVLFIVLGEAVGGAISFYLSRILGRKIVNKFFPGQEHLVAKILAKLNTTKGLFYGRLILMPYPELFSYIAGLTKAKFVPFLLIYTSVGIVPATIGAALGPVLAQAEGWQTAVFALALGLAISLFLFFWIQKLEKEPIPPASS